MTEPNSVENTVDAPLTKESVREMIKNAVLKCGKSLGKDDKIEQIKAMVKFAEEAQDPARTLGMTDSDLANLYSYGYSLCNAGRYDEAIAMFTYLLTLTPLYPSFLQALAVCYHRQKKYEIASHYYLQAAIIEKTNPMHYFYAFDCFKELNDPATAMVMLANVIELCKADKKYEKVQANAEILVEGLIKQHPDLFEKVDKGGA